MDSRVNDAAREIISAIMTEDDEATEEVKDLLKPILLKHFILIQEDTMLDGAMKAMMFRDQDKNSSPNRMYNANDIADIFKMT